MKNEKIQTMICKSLHRRQIDRAIRSPNTPNNTKLTKKQIDRAIRSPNRPNNTKPK